MFEILPIRFKFNHTLNVQRGYSALLFAAENGREPLFTKLLEHYADIHLVTSDGWNALMCLCFRSSFPKGSHGLHMIQAIVHKGISVNTINNDGNTALMLAASNDHVEIVKFLLESGADVNVVNKVQVGIDSKFGFIFDSRFNFFWTEWFECLGTG